MRKPMEQTPNIWSAERIKSWDADAGFK